MIISNSDMIRYGSIIILLLLLFIYIYKLGKDSGEQSFISRIKRKSNYKKINDIEEVKRRIKNGEL